MNISCFTKHAVRCCHSIRCVSIFCKLNEVWRNLLRIRCTADQTDPAIRQPFLLQVPSCCPPKLKTTTFAFSAIPSSFLTSDLDLRSPLTTRGTSVTSRKAGTMDLRKTHFLKKLKLRNEILTILSVRNMNILKKE
jgi:hypothetical protein